MRSRGLTKKSIGLGLLVVAWLGVVGTGMAALTRYKETPGPAARAPESWPADAGIARTEGRPTLIMFAHPLCPCTRASLAELARIQQKVGGRVDVHVRFVRLEGTPEEWATSDLWRSARAIPGVDVAADPDGAIAARFGSATSGQVLLYDAHGVLRFRGGITPARGHEGDTPGADTIVREVQGDAVDPTDDEAPVFGCELKERTARKDP